MGDKEIALITALAGAVPTIGKWIAGLIDGNDDDPDATRRVRDVLPERSASERAGADIERGR